MMNKDNAKTMVRTHRIPFRPDTNADQDQSANVLPIGTHLGEFEIQKVIGEGGFGIVYLAYDHSLERHVALKEYMPSGLATRTAGMSVTVRSNQKLETYTLGLKSFINEARMLAQFDSPALVKVHLFWEGNGTAYMVMPYYEGTTLKQALKEQQIKPTEPWLRLLLADLFDAIDIIHRAQCLHRDIAPDNILLLKDGRPLLLDFGAARRVIGDLTQCLTAILKPGFAPIEQYADIPGLRQGPWTDIYALAAVVYYLIGGNSPTPAVARMVQDSMPPAREIGKGKYSSNFLAAVDKALSVKPEHRHQSIAELRRALNIMEAVPRTLPQEITDWGATTFKTASAPEEKPGTAAAPQPSKLKGSPALRIEPTLMADDKTAIAPEKTAPAAPPKPQVKPESKSAPKTKPLSPEQVEAEKTMAWQKIIEQEQSMTKQSKHGKTLQWTLMAIMVVTAVGAGIYLGTNRPEDKSAANAINFSAGDSGGGNSASGAPEQTTVKALAAPIVSPELLSEIESWKKASASDKASDYEDYLRQYPKGSFAAIARLRLERLQIPPAATASTTARTGKPSPLPSTEVAQAKPVPEKKPKTEKPPVSAAKTPVISPDEEAWIRASTLNGESAYMAYLSEYPNGRFAAIAKDRLASLKQAEAAPAKEAPPAPISAASDKPQKNVDITPNANDKLASLKPAESPAQSAPKSAEAIPATTVAEPAPITGNKSVALDGQIISGDFSFDPKGRVSGQVRISWANGDRYEGSLVRGIKEGRGRFVWRNGQRYTGEWAKDLPNGKGAFVFPDGSRYEGEVRDGVRHGRGTTRFRNGDIYVGDWADGKSNGQGRYTWADGSVWEGEFRGGQRTENGKMTFSTQAIHMAREARSNEASDSSGDDGQKALAGSSQKSERNSDTADY